MNQFVCNIQLGLLRIDWLIDNSYVLSMCAINLNDQEIGLTVPQLTQVEFPVLIFHLITKQTSKQTNNDYSKPYRRDSHERCGVDLMESWMAWGIYIYIYIYIRLLSGGSCPTCPVGGFGGKIPICSQIEIFNLTRYKNIGWTQCCLRSTPESCLAPSALKSCQRMWLCSIWKKLQTFTSTNQN